MSHIDKLKEKINTDTAIVTVIGMGYVGLPLALLLETKKLRLEFKIKTLDSLLSIDAIFSLLS